MPQAPHWLADLVAALLVGPGLLLILSGTMLGLRAIKIGVLPVGGAPSVLRARRLFVAGWFILAVGIAVGMTVVSAYLDE